MVRYSVHVMQLELLCEAIAHCFGGLWNLELTCIYMYMYLELQYCSTCMYRVVGIFREYKPSQIDR